MLPYKVSGINIRVGDFGEADKLVTVFSRERGKLKVLAKGSRKAGSKLSGRTELFVLSRMHLVTGRNFEILTDSQIMESFENLRNDLNRLNEALYFVWLVNELSPLEQPNFRVFELLLGSLKELLSARTNPLKIKENFERELTALEGIKPLKILPNFSSTRYLENYLEKVFPNYFSEVSRVNL